MATRIAASNLSDLALTVEQLACFSPYWAQYMRNDMGSDITDPESIVAKIAAVRDSGVLKQKLYPLVDDEGIELRTAEDQNTAYAALETQISELIEVLANSHTGNCRPITQEDINKRDENQNSFWEHPDGTRTPAKNQMRFILRETTTMRDLENACREAFIEEEYAIDGDGNQQTSGDKHKTLFIGRDLFFDIVPEGETNRENTSHGLHVICTHPAFFVLRFFDETADDKLVFTAEWGQLAAFWQTLAHEECESIEELRECAFNNYAAKSPNAGYGNIDKLLDTPVMDYINRVKQSISFAKL